MSPGPYFRTLTRRWIGPFAYDRVITGVPSMLYAYVHVESDGRVREVHLDERAWLETEYSGGDGAAPSVKDSYDERNGWGDLSGFLRRDRLPPGITVDSAPAVNPNRGMSEQETIAFFRAKGVEVVKNADGSLTIKAKGT